jgi:hypothetical protein
MTGTPRTATPTRTSTVTPSLTPTPCGSTGNYSLAQGTGTIVPGTVDAGSHCDDCLTTITLPFAYRLYGVSYSTAGADSNGTLKFVPSASTFTNTCLPAAGDTYTIYPYWDDQLTAPAGKGIFTSISGTAPNRIFNIEWRTCSYQTASTCLANSDANYEVRLYEGQSKFDVVYGPMASTQTGISATIGVQREATLFSQYSCNTAVPGLSGLKLTFSQPPCTTPTPIASPTATVCPLQFQDADSTNPFYAFIRCLACRGIISGYNCGSPGEPCIQPGTLYFRPNNNITRGQLAKIVSTSAGFTGPTGPQIFEDVPSTSPFYEWIQQLASRGFMSGYDCGAPNEPCVLPDNRPYFRPNNNATRGQISKIVSNAKGFTGPTGTQIFEDVPPTSPFYEWVQQLASRGFMSGYTCGGPNEPCVLPDNRPYFRPNNNATRGQTSKIVANSFFPNCQTPSKK